MKTTIVVLFCVLIAGCAPKPDPRVAVLEKEVARLSALTEIQIQIQEEYDAGRKRDHAELKSIRDVIDAQRELISAHGEMIVVMYKQATNRIPSLQRELQAINALMVDQTKNGIPLTVWNKMKADAAAQAPGDYIMQEALVAKQLEGFRKVRGSR